MTLQTWHTLTLPKTCVVNMDFDEPTDQIVITIEGEGPPPPEPTRQWTLTLPPTGPMVITENAVAS